MLLVRHGRTPTTGAVLPGRAPGLHLSAEGEAQAAAVADRISAIGSSGAAGSDGSDGSLGETADSATKTTKAAKAAKGRPRPTKTDRKPPVAVYASPLERTSETARPIARRLGLRVRTERGLVECDFGEWTGTRLQALAKKPEWSQVQRHPSSFRFPAGESFLEMQSRMVSTLKRLVDRHPGETIVAVSHADPIKAAVASAAGTHLDLFQRLVITPCSVSAVVHTEAGPHVLCVNSTASLTELSLA